MFLDFSILEVVCSMRIHCLLLVMLTYDDTRELFDVGGRVSFIQQIGIRGTVTVTGDRRQGCHGAEMVAVRAI